MRTLVLSVFATLALAAPASAFTGADFTKTRYGVNYQAKLALIQIACPPKTQSTGRVGDFSFCTGYLEITRKGKVVGYAPVALRTNDRITHRVPLTQGASRYLRRHRRMSVHLKIVTHDGLGNLAAHEEDAVLFDDFHDAL